MMKKFWFLLICLVAVQWTYAQSTITIGVGSSVSVGNGSNVTAGYRDGTMSNNGYFNSKSITFDPVATAATLVTQTSFNANWNVSSGANGYKLDVSTVSNFTSFVTGYQNLDVGITTSFSVSSNLSAGSTYYYRVRAYDIDGITGYSNVITVVMAPQNPVATAATNINDISFSANWGSVTGATGYRLDVSTTMGFTAGTFVAGFEDRNVGNVTTFSITGLTGNTTYYYRVRAYNTYGSSGNSNSINVLTAPAAPTAIAATPIGQTSFTAKWRTSAGATKYYLDVSLLSNFSTYVTGYQNLDIGSDTTYSVGSNISAGTTYYYRVRASNGTSTSTNSNTTNLITVPPNPVVAAATNVLSTSFDANWSASTGATKYYLDVSADINFGSFVTDYENRDVGNVTTFSVNTNLSGGVTYYYRIRANNSGGTSGNSGATSVFTIPLAPVAIAPDPIAQTSFSAKWNASVGATKYYLDIATDNNFLNLVTGWNNVDVGGVTTYSVNTNITSGTTYYYRVRANNATGTSLNSNTITLITVPPNPISAAATNVTEESLYANWNFSNSATGYRLDVSDQSDFSSRLAGYDDLDVLNVTTYLVTGLSVNTTYYYRVRAYNGSGTSEGSGTITQTTAPSAPTADAASSIAQASFDASWSASAGATGYRLDVATNSGFTSGTFVTGYQDIDVGNVVTYTVNTNLIEGTTYYYRVRTYNANGTSTSSNTITLITAPGNPIAKTATSIASTSFNANWDLITGASGYRLDVSINSGFTAGNFVTGYENKDVGAVTTSTVNTNLTAGTTYYFRIRAYNSGGTSGNSGAITVITVPTTPTANAATSITGTSFTSNWDPTIGAGGYYFDVATDNGFLSLVSGFNNKDVGNVTSYIVTGLTSGTNYYYRLKAYNLSGTGGNSNTQTALTISPSPSAAVASAITATSFSANWNAATGASGYYLDVATNSSFTSFVAGFENKDVLNVITYPVPGLTAGNTYYYRVRSYNLSGTSGNSSIITLLTIPPAPVEQAASSITENSFTANWNASTGASGYYLDVATDNVFSSFVAGYNGKNVGNVISYSVTALTENTDYYYRIRAYNTGGSSTNSNTITLTTTVGIPAAPAVTPATVIATTSFSANWIASSGATGYYLDVATDAGFTSYVAGFNNKDVGAVVTYSVPGLTEGSTYYYLLRAYNGSGTSGNSNTITVKTIPLAPVEQAASSIVETSFDANWNASAGATGYYLDVATDIGFTSYVAGFNNRDVANVTTFSVTGLTGSTSYFYRVRAYNTGGTSGNSGTINPTTAVGSSLVATAATLITATSFSANWNTYAGATGYKLAVSTVSDFSTFVGLFNDLDVLNVLTYSVTGLTAGTTYYYRVKAYDGGGTISTSGTILVLTLPAAPTSNSATSLAEINFTANWNISASATGYYLDVAADNGFTSFVTGFNNKYVNNVTSYLITGLTSGTNYYYRVRAKNGSGVGDNSGTITALTLPHSPTATYATAIANTSFSANWNSSTGATGYRLDVSTVSNFASYVAGYNNLDVSNVTDYSVTGLSGGTVYYYRVRAYNGNGTSGYSGTVSMLTLPSAPVELAASSITKISFDANWNSSTGATKYYLDVSTTSNFTGGTFVSGYQNLDVGNATTYSIPGLTSGTNYYYRVRAFNQSGTSDNSGTTTLITIPPAPGILSASTIQNTSFTANWNSSTGAGGYRLDASTASDFSSFVAGFNNLDVSNVTSFSVTGLSGGTTYYYRVRAYNGSGTSDESGIMTVLTAPANPTATAATSLVETSFYANWNASGGTSGYKLDVCTDAGFTTFVPGYNNRDVGSVTTFPVTGLNGGTTYYYQVRSYSGSRTSGNSNSISALTKPPAPLSAAASSIVVTSFAANWNSSTGTDKYYLDVSTNSGFTSFVAGFNNQDVGNITTYSVTGLSANTNYYYRVRANNATGTSNNSTTITVLTGPTTPTTLAATNISNTSFRTNWNATPGATKYYLDVSIASNFSSFVGIYNNKDIGNVTTYLIDGLNGSTTYYYRLRAYNGSGTSGNSGPDNITTAADPSGVPTATAATSIAETSFSANWNSVGGAAGYRLDVSTDWNFVAGSFITNFNDRDVGNVTTFSVTGLIGGTTYYYRLRSYNVSGTSSNSGKITALTVPQVPTAASATTLTETSFSANWSGINGATGYYLDVATDAGFTSFVVGYNNKDVSNVTTYSVSGLSGGTTYHYRVRAYNGSGPSGNSNTISALTISSAPTATAATSPLETSFEANWNPVTGASGYRLDVSTNSSFNAGTFLTGYNDKDVSNVTTYSISGLTAGSTYYYRVRSYNASGTSSNSNAITALTLSSAPVATAASAVTGTSFSANWNEATGATKYYLDISTDSGFGTFLAGYQDKDVSNVTTYSIPGLTINTNYYYRVRTYNSSGASSNSNTITVLTSPTSPVALDATSSAENSFTANWNSSAGATGYKIDVSTDVGFGAGTFESGYEDKDVGNVTTYSVTGISSGYTHYYRVRAYNTGGTSTNSGTIKVLGVPSAAQATAITINSFSANWNAVTNVLGYRLDVATTIDFTAGTFHTGLENKDVGNVTTYPVSGLISNTTYYYRVRAYDATTTSGNSNTILVKNRPNPPVALDATGIGNTNFTARWNASVGGAAGYKLDVATDAGFTSFVVGYQDKVVYNVTTFAIENLSPGTAYYYRVRAYNSLGDSDNSNTINVITVPFSPSAEPASNITQTSFIANWTAASGASGYLIDVSTSANFEEGSFVNDFIHKSVNDLGCSVNGLVPGTTYYYRVRSNYPSITSGNSNTITVITIPPAPVMNAATDVQRQSFIANWDSTKGASGYKIDISIDQNFPEGKFVAGFNDKNVGLATLCTVTGLNPNVIYYSRVRAYNSGGVSAFSNVISVITQPSKPVAKPATQITQTSFSANWEASAGVAGYKLDLSTDQNFITESFVAGYNDKDLGNVTTFSISGLNPGSTYYYRVRPYNVERTGENSNTISTITIPSNPIAFAATNITSERSTMNWNGVIGASGYKMDLSTSSDFSSFVAGYQNLDVSNVITYSIKTNINKGTQFYYRIRSYNVNGVSGNSNTISFITLPNKKPVLSNVETSIVNYLEESSHVQITNTIAVSDSDNTELNNAQIRISGNYQKNQDLLVFANQNGISGEWNNNTGIMTLTGKSSLENYLIALRSIGYSNLSKAPSTLLRNISFVVNDGIDNSITSGNSERIVNVIPINNPPIVIEIEMTNLDYLEGSGAVSISETIVPSDADNTHLMSASIKISGNYKIGEDVLGFIDQNGITGKWNETSGSLLLDGTATLENYQAALRSVTYTNTCGKPSTEIRTISFTAQDLTSVSSAVARNINVIPVNTPPVLSSMETLPLEYKIKQGKIQLTNSLVIEDIDCEGTGSAILEITGNYFKDEDILLCERDSSITKTWDPQSGKMIFGGNLSANNFQDIVRYIRYKNVAANPMVLERTITITFNDGKDNSNSVTRKILMPSENVAPELSEMERSKIIYSKNSPPVYLTDSLRISDEDNMNLFGADVKIVTHLKADEDELIFNDNENITGSYDASSGTMELRGQATIADYESAVKSVMYKNIKGENATKTIKKIKFTAWDGIIFSDTLSREMDVDGIITGIDEDMDGIPAVYSLQQNYPNPFNPVTVIKYGLAKPGNVNLTVYNILGEEVSVLIDKEQNAGYYKINFNAARLSSGIYFYRIQVGEFSMVRKMLMIK